MHRIKYPQYGCFHDGASDILVSNIKSTCRSGFVKSHCALLSLVSHSHFMDLCTEGNFLQQQGDGLWQSHLTET